MQIIVTVAKFLAMGGVAAFGAAFLVYVLKQAFTDENKDAALDTMNRGITKVLNSDQKRKFDRYLVQTGITYRLNFMTVTPASYILCMLVSGLVFLVAFYLLGLEKYIFIGFLVGFFGWDVVMRVMGQTDNKEIQDDVSTILSNLRVELDAGIYLLDGLVMCEPLLKNKRFRSAIEELTTALSSPHVSNMDAIDAFNAKFKNVQVANLSIFFRNYILYGVSDKYLDDMMQQVNSMSEAQALREENDLDQKMNLFSIAFFGLIFFFLFYGMTLVMNTQGVFGG